MWPMTGADDVLLSGHESNALLYKPGDLILAAEPIVHVLDSQMRGKRCDSCFQHM